MNVPLLASTVSLSLFLAPIAAAQSYTFSAIAGQPPQVGSLDGIGTDARFFFPGYNTLDGAGNLYVADTNNNTIRKITPAGVVTTIAGLAGQSGTTDGTGSVARFNHPYGIVLDASGNFYVADYLNHTIRKMTAAGVVTTLAGSAGVAGTADGTGATARFNGPRGIAIDASGNLYVTDRLNRTIRKISSAGVVSTVAGLAGFSGGTDGAGTNARFTLPNGIAIDGGGNLFIADANGTVRKISPAGAVTTVAGTANLFGSTNAVGVAARFNTPQGIAVDPAGNLYVTDFDNNNVRKIDSGGTVTNLAGGNTTRGYANGTGSSARFYAPTGISVDAAGNVYVSDSTNQAIRKVTSIGVVSTYAGPTGNTGSTDGVGSAARFYFPRGVAADSQGNVFVADWVNATIRRITPTGSVSTFAGSATAAVGNVDATGGAARFFAPLGVGVDASDNLYIADSATDTIRKITPGAVVSTLAGSNLVTGSTDGIGTSARFDGPFGVASERNGTLYIADTFNNTIRKMTPDGTVTTLAGLAGVAGSTDGVGSSARFNLPAAVAVDPAGNVYVADTSNSTIRKITPAGVVTTVAGSAGLTGSTDATGGAARFRGPWGVAVDAAGNLFVADTNNSLIRKITPAGAVTTIGGSTDGFITHEGTGTNARFIFPVGIFIDPKGVLYITDDATNSVVKGVLDSIPDISKPPSSVSSLLGTSTTFSVTASGGGLRYQWKLNGTAIPGATNSSYTVVSISNAVAGTYTVDVTNSAGTTTSTAGELAVTLPGRITNLSIFTSIDIPGDSFTVGTSVGGSGTSGTKRLLVRAVGPGLTSLGVGGALGDPKVDFYSGQTVVASNDNWGGTTDLMTTMVSVGAFGLPAASQDAVLAYTADVASYTVKVGPVGNATGFVIAEIYDATPKTSVTTTTPRLVNISVLKNIGTGLIAGFYLDGTTPVRVLIRAIGPALGLAPFNIDGVVADPKLEVFNSSQVKIDENDNWGGTPSLSATFASVAAFPLPPTSRDAALVVTLTPGSVYTVKVSGVNNTSGIGLVEMYEVLP